MTAFAAGMPVEIDAAGRAFPASFGTAPSPALPPAGVPASPATTAALPPEVRWALLLDDLLQMRDRLPVPAPRARRIGDPAPGPQSAPPEWLEPAKAWLAGTLSRYCDLRAARLASNAPADREVEARLMILTADHLLAERLDWAGRPWWHGDLLARALTGRPAVDMPLRGALQAKLAAGDPTLARIVPVLQGLGLADRLFPTAQERALCARSLSAHPAPAWPAPAGPLRIPEGERRSGRRRAGLLAAFGIALAAPAALIAWQAMLWHDFLARLGALLATG